MHNFTDSYRTKRDLWVFGALSLLYIAVLLLVAPESSTLQRYNISSEQAKLLGLAVSLPYIVIWFVAIRGFIRMRSYTDAIKDEEDGAALRKIATGLGVLAYSMPIITLANRVLSELEIARPDFKAESTIMLNFVSLGFVLGGFWFINQGAEKLGSILRKDAREAFPYNSLYVAITVLLSAGFMYLTFANPARQFPTTDTNGQAAYYMNDFWLWIFIVVPYLFVWHWGMNAVKNIHMFSRSVRGDLYRLALKSLAAGVFIIVLSQAALRYLTSLATLLQGASLRLILLVIFLLLVVIAIGYILVAHGSKKLKQIEEA